MSSRVGDEPREDLQSQRRLRARVHRSSATREHRCAEGRDVELEGAIGAVFAELFIELFHRVARRVGKPALSGAGREGLAEIPARLAFGGLMQHLDQVTRSFVVALPRLESQQAGFPSRVLSWYSEHEASRQRPLWPLLDTSDDAGPLESGFSPRSGRFHSQTRGSRGWNVTALPNAAGIAHTLARFMTIERPGPSAFQSSPRAFTQRELP